jgi:hypothetical protein
MTQNPGYTIRSEPEQNAVTNMRNAIFWRVKVQLQSFHTVTAQQFHEIVEIAWRDAQTACQELMNLYPGIDAHQKSGWRAFDCFDRVASRPPVQQPQPMPQPQPLPQQPLPHAAPPAQEEPSPPAGQPQKQKSDLDNIGKDLEKGLKDVGGALKDLFGSKKKK